MSLTSLFRGPPTTDRLVRAARNEPLSDVLPAVLSAARQADLDELGDWVSLEMGGYLPSNPAGDSETETPQYRTVRGRHVDRFKNPIEIPDLEISDLVNKVRLREPIGRIEEFAGGDEPIFIGDTQEGALLRKHTDLKPHRFYFRPEAASAVVRSTQHQLIERLEEHRDALNEVDLHHERIPGENLPTLLTDHVLGLGVAIIATVVGGLVVAYFAFRFGWV